jgi:hypothetical protein
VAAWTFLPPQPTSVPVVIAAALAPTLALADHRALILPPGIIGLLTITALGTFTIDATLQDTWDRTGPGMIGAAAIAAITALFWWPNRHRFGSGDVALIAACACFLGRHGWAAALWGTAIVTLTGALRAILYRLRHRVRGEIMPVGPALITGWWLAETLLIASLLLRAARVASTKTSGLRGSSKRSTATPTILTGGLTRAMSRHCHCPSVCWRSNRGRHGLHAEAAAAVGSRNRVTASSAAMAANVALGG